MGYLKGQFLSSITKVKGMGSTRELFLRGKARILIIFHFYITKYFLLGIRQVQQIVHRVLEVAE